MGEARSEKEIMTNPLLKYRESSPDTSNKQNNQNPLLKYRNEEKNKIYGQDEEEFYNQHPIIKAIGKALTKVPGLETAANYAEGTINKPIESLGLPHAARGLFQGGENLIRGVGNLAPGVNIPSANIRNIPIRGQNPKEESLLQKLMGFGGEVASDILPINKANKAAQEVLKNVKIPQALKNIIIGSGVGAVLSPDNRKTGAVIGGALPAAADIGGKVASKIYSHLPEYLQHPINSVKGTYNLPAKLREAAEKEQHHALIAEEENKLNQQFGNKKYGTLKNEAAELENKANQEQNIATNIPHEEQSLENALPPTEGQGLEESAQNLLKTKEQKAAEKENEIAEKHLGKGKAHRLRVGVKLNKALEEKQKEIGSGYDKYIDSLKDKHVTLSNPRDAKSIASDIHNLLKQGDTSSKEMMKLTDELERIGKSEIMPADKFVSAYRSLRGMAQKTRSSAYGKSPQEFDSLIERANSMDADVDRMKQIIDKGLGKESLKDLNNLNQRYATEFAPVYQEEFFNYMQKHGKAPSNMIEALSGERHIKQTNPNKITGKKIIKDIIKNDPELMKYVLGERFAKNPKGLHESDESVEEYLNHESMRPLKNAVQEHKSALHDVEMAKENIANTKKTVEQLKKDADQIRKSWQELKSKKITRENALKNADKYREEARNLKIIAKQLEEASNKTGLSLKKKLEAKKQAAKAKEDATNFGKLVSTIAVLYAGKKGLNRLMP